MGLPTKDREYLEVKKIAFEEFEEGGQHVVLFKEHVLPADKYDSPTAHVLVVLPGGYADAPPDMFYTLPWLKLKQTGRFPNAADQPQQFRNQSWQRWSRHNNEWRAGIDGIWTVLQRVVTAIEVAA